MPEWRKQAAAQRAAARNAPRSKPTHFLCLPLTTTISGPLISEALQRFKAEAEALEDLDAHVKELLGQRSLRPPGTLHLTLGVMNLATQAHVREAVRMLNSLDLEKLLNTSEEEILEDAAPIHEPATKLDSNRPLVVSLRSLLSMNEPGKARVLYIEPEDASQRLYPFCKKLRDTFMEKGFLISEDRDLKLHITILNTVYAKTTMKSNSKDNGGFHPNKPSNPNEKSNAEEEVQEEGDELQKVSHGPAEDENKDVTVTEPKGRRRPRPKPLTFDATLLLDAFKDFEWISQIRLTRLAICKMGANVVFDQAGNVVDEAYEEVAFRDLPAGET